MPTAEPENLLNNDETIITIDREREISFRSAKDGSIVITMEDPHAITIVQMPKEKAAELIEKLTAMLDG